MSESEQVEATHEEVCDQALKHYEEISNEVSHYSSVVPKAIKFYKERHVPRGMRKFITSTKELELALEEGWTFDPWLNPSGRPTIIGDQPYRGDHPALSAVDPREPKVYWILVKGTPEQIAEMDPIAELPELEEEPEPGTGPYGLKTMFVSYNSEEKAPDGYVVMHKDHIFAKGTVYTLPPNADLGRAVTTWDLAKDLSNLSGHLGVDEAHDVITGILKKDA